MKVQIIVSVFLLLAILGVSTFFIKRTMLSMTKGAVLSMKALALLAALLYFQHENEQGKILLILLLVILTALLIYLSIFLAIFMRIKRHGGSANIDLENSLKN